MKDRLTGSQVADLWRVILEAWERCNSDDEARYVARELGLLVTEEQTRLLIDELRRAIGADG